MDKKKLKSRWTYALWAKIMLALICAVSASAMLVSTIAALLFLEFPDQEKELQAKYENAAYNYSAYTLQLLRDGYTPEEIQELLAKEAPNFQFGLVKTQEDHLEQVDLDQEDIWLIGSPADADRYQWSFEGMEGMDYNYSLASVQGGNLGSYWPYGYDADEDEDIEVDTIIYDSASGLFYLRSDNQYYPLPEVELTVNLPLTWNRVNSWMQETYGISAKAVDEQTGKELTAHPDQALTDFSVLDQETGNKLLALFDSGIDGSSDFVDEEGNSILYVTLTIHGKLDQNASDAYTYTAERTWAGKDFLEQEDLAEYAGYWIGAKLYDTESIVTKTFERKSIDQITTVSQADVILDQAPGENAEIITDRKLTWINQFDLSTVHTEMDYSQTAIYWVLSWTPETIDTGCNDIFAQWTLTLPGIYRIAKWCLPVQVCSVIILVIAVILLASALGHRREDNEIHLRLADRIPYILWLLFIIPPIEFLLIRLVWIFIEQMEDFGYLNAIVFSLEATIAGMLIGEELVATTIVRIKGKVFWRYTLWHYILAPFRRLAGVVREHVPQFIRLLFLVGGVSLLELLLVTIGMASYTFRTIAFLLFLLVKGAEFMVLLIIGMQLIHLHEGSKKIAAGDLEAPVDTSKLKWKFKEHGENLNHISDAIEAAVQKEMKSEHFQTELITNVSHDIKTPLTSIINYVDLMKKEEITDPKMQEYVAVLDRQSGKLKKLIEDLMEASKASTGNLTVNMEETDAAILLQQAVGEFEERLEKNHLQVVVTSPEPPVTIMADGRHLWRVFDNLLGNICKYALPGSRVYIDLAQKDGKTTIVFRNISAAQLNITSEELMARFVRGDASRNTEGSGLGLNIAQSLMTLMHGSLRLDVDGDLFKVTLEF